MGALPSHETHERGLYSHRHGRNRRSEIILIPLTTAFFPSPDCPLFRHLYNARYRRTAKYYFRALRSAQTPRETDYFCTTTAINEAESFEEFYRAYLVKREQGSGEAVPPLTRPAAVPTVPTGVSTRHPTATSPLFSDEGAATGGVGWRAAGGGPMIPPVDPTPDSLNAGGLPPRVGPMDFRSYADTREGLYQVLIRDNDLGVFPTDEALRQAYKRQLGEQRTERRRFRGPPVPPQQKQQGDRVVGQAVAAISAGEGGGAGVVSGCPAAPLFSAAPHTSSTSPPYESSNWMGASTSLPPGGGAPGPHPLPFPAMSMEELSFDEFVFGYVAAKRYVKGKSSHTHYSPAAASNREGDPVNPLSGGLGRRNASPEYTAEHYKHVTSPVAYHVRPLPCVIASRYDPAKPPPVEDPVYVPFGGSYVKIMGMFGLFPATVAMRQSTAHGADDATATPHAQRRFPRKEGHSNGDDDVDAATEVEAHLLKGTMFVDKDVGDQILGNVVMLATYMYVRQCIEAHLHPQAIPMLPVYLRFPLSNIPMLQFVREFRVRLRTLTGAGTAKAGQRPFHVGMSGFNPEDLAVPHCAALQRLEEEGYLFEPDVPTAAASPAQLFLSPEYVNSPNAPLRSHTGNMTLSCGRYPIIMMSGFNVQTTPLRHPLLNATGYPPAVTAAAAAAAVAMHTAYPNAAEHSPISASSVPVSPQIHAGGVGRGATFPATAPPPLGQSYYGAAGVGSATGSTPPMLSPLSAPSAGTATSSGTTTTTTPMEEAVKIAVLRRRKQRYRIWVEDGHMCIWASAAYARRAALILSQQLNTTVDSNAVPEQRSWNYRGLLHEGTVVPLPRQVNDVIIVAEDIPRMGLWQGDVLRCCTEVERRVLFHSQGTARLPLPSAKSDAAAATAAGLLAVGASWPPPQDPICAASSLPPAGGKLDAVEPPGKSTSPSVSAGTGNGSTAVVHVGHINYTSNHVSNPLLQEREKAPPGCFWVRGAGGLDDCFTNITESNMPPHPKVEKQLQQAAMQRAKKLASAAAAATNSSSGRKRRSTAHEAAMVPASTVAQLLVDIDRREGTLNIEEVVLAWIKVVAILTRDSTEEDKAWVRDPGGDPVRMDRYVIRRYEHDGVRFFIGVTPRFVGQQRRIEKVLGEVYAMEQREGRQRRQRPSEDDEDGREEAEDDEKPRAENTSSVYSDDEVGMREGRPFQPHRGPSPSYALPPPSPPSQSGARPQGLLPSPEPVLTTLGDHSGGGGSLFDCVWGQWALQPPPTATPTKRLSLATAGPGVSAGSNAAVEVDRDHRLTARSRAEQEELSAERNSRLAFAAVFGEDDAPRPTTATATLEQNDSPKSTATLMSGPVPLPDDDLRADREGVVLEVDDWLMSNLPEVFDFPDITDG